MIPKTWPPKKVERPSSVRQLPRMLSYQLEKRTYIGTDPTAALELERECVCDFEGNKKISYTQDLSCRRGRRICSSVPTSAGSRAATKPGGNLNATASSCGSSTECTSKRHLFFSTVQALGATILVLTSHL